MTHENETQRKGSCEVVIVTAIKGIVGNRDVLSAPYPKTSRQPDRRGLTALLLDQTSARVFIEEKQVPAGLTVQLRNQALLSVSRSSRVLKPQRCSLQSCQTKRAAGLIRFKPRFCTISSEKQTVPPSGEVTQKHPVTQ